MIYKGYLVSHGGKVRRNNEDNAYLEGVWRYDDKQFSWEYECEKAERMLCGIFDGVGGEDHGEIASRIAAETMFEFQDTGLKEEGFEEYVFNANARILLAPESGNMASTFAALFVEDDYYHFCNMGDSRIYLFRDKELTQISKDHNMVTQLLKEGILTPEQAARHPDLHTIYQYLGMNNENSEEELILEPYCPEPVKARDGDICLLCTDGLTDMVVDDDIRSILSENQNFEDKVKHLLKTALEHGGRDNITVLLVEAMHS